MELLFFLILALVLLALIATGLYTGNFPTTLLGAVLCISLGLIVLTQGLTTQKIVNYSVDDLNDDATVITPQYETFDATGDMEIWVMGNIMLYGGVVFLLFAIYYSFFGSTGEPEKLGEV